MLRGLWLLIGLALSLTPVVAIADSALQTAQRFFNELNSFRADFVQQVIADNGRQLQTSSGQVMIQRPDHFRWDYRQPYRQLIVADGEQLWIYDEDLEQVTVSALTAALAKTPALLLSQQKNLADDFVVTAMAQQQGLPWLRLVPKDKDALYTEIRLAITAQGLEGMELVDGFGQMTRLLFTDIALNAATQPAWFRFTPPAGVDVVRDQVIVEPSP